MCVPFMSITCFCGKNDNLSLSSNESFRWVLTEGDFLKDRALDFKDSGFYFIGYIYFGNFKICYWSVSTKSKFWSERDGNLCLCQTISLVNTMAIENQDINC